MKDQLGKINIFLWASIVLILLANLIVGTMDMNDQQQMVKHDMACPDLTGVNCLGKKVVIIHD